jgi:putative ABC transport system substrate-binding protein
MTRRYQESRTAAETLGLTVQPLPVREPEGFDEAFEAMTREPPGGLFMVTDALTFLNRRRVFEFATEHRLPAIYEFGSLVRDGGLMSYGPDMGEMQDRVAGLIDRILKGAKPEQLPFEQPTRFRFTINLKTAKALDLTIPPTLLARADEVIE